MRLCVTFCFAGRSRNDGAFNSFKTLKTTTKHDQQPAALRATTIDL